LLAFFPEVRHGEAMHPVSDRVGRGTHAQAVEREFLPVKLHVVFRTVVLTRDGDIAQPADILKFESHYLRETVCIPEVMTVDIDFHDASPAHASHITAGSHHEMADCRDSSKVFSQLIRYIIDGSAPELCVCRTDVIAHDMRPVVLV